MHKGRLLVRGDGRFGLPDGYYWTCGDYIEVYDSLSDGWIIGRVEFCHVRDCYYFTDSGDFDVPLYRGMLVRA